MIFLKFSISLFSFLPNHLVVYLAEHIFHWAHVKTWRIIHHMRITAMLLIHIQRDGVIWNLRKTFLFFWPMQVTYRWIRMWTSFKSSIAAISVGAFTILVHDNSEQVLHYLIFLLFFFTHHRFLMIHSFQNSNFLLNFLMTLLDIKRLIRWYRFFWRISAVYLWVTPIELIVELEIIFLHTF